ncbi:MAG: hypothetical protein KA035_02360 [Candidatus Levybacteria bacterium]|nr:hypothetical protein [Candidatus Levybacteria bacterium]
MDLQNLLYALLGLILVLCYGVLFLAYKISKQNKVINQPKENYGATLEIIESAQKQANAIVEKAVDSAKHILFETEYVKQDITKEMQDSLSKVAEETIKMVQGRSAESDKEFRAVVDEIKQDFAREASQKLSAIEKIATDETNDFKEILRRETLGSQAIIGKKIGDDFADVQREIDEYKKLRFAEVDRNIDGIVKQVVKDTLGQSITIPIQEDLVVASLENAKKVGLFKNFEENTVNSSTPPASEFVLPEKAAEEEKHAA